jgi:hypothetical protein
VGYNVTQAHARGVWYAAPWIYERDKWAVFSPTGICVALVDSKKEATDEAIRWAEADAIKETPSAALRQFEADREHEAVGD